MESPLIIMIIDDDEDDRKIFIEALQELDNTSQIISAANGREGLLMLHKKGALLPSIIFLDMNMPQLNGLQCLAEIRRINGLKKTPVVIYTTATSVEKQNGVHELDPVHFLSKPARFKEIVNSLDEILKSKWMYDA